MAFNVEKHKRKSVRLRNFDYTGPGAYFITICTFEKECHLGEMRNKNLKYSPIGLKVRQVWREIPRHFNYILLDQFVVMPNHIHGIIIQQRPYQPGETNRELLLSRNVNEDNNMDQCRPVIHNARIDNNFYSDISPKPGSLAVIVRTFKGVVTRWCRVYGYSYFNWQRNYHEHVIRSKDELVKIRQYIKNNPLKWDDDPENPQNHRKTVTR
jgi:putative transposase